jgi:hypothetical protein
MKAHLVVREDRLQAGSTVEAICGAIVTECEIALMWDTLLVGGPMALSSILCCKNCWERLVGALVATEGSSRYVYGVVPPDKRRNRKLRDAELETDEAA